MNVKNRKCIRKLSLKSLYANRRRNLIAIFAIALTTLLFTSMFTIVLSLNASYETYQFRQVGGYAHGTFKDVSPEQAERIAAHPKKMYSKTQLKISLCEPSPQSDRYFCHCADNAAIYVHVHHCLVVERQL